jgi:hypothetical protein
MPRPTARAALILACFPLVAVFGQTPAAPAADKAFTLEEAIALALKKNFDIQIQAVTSENARETFNATNAIFDPTLTSSILRSVSQAASNTSDSRMQTLAAASTALAAVNAANAVLAGQGQTINGKDNQIVTATDANGNPTATIDANAADKLGGITVSLSVGSSKSQSHSSQTADQAKGSSIAAGGDVIIVAQGAGKESDILIQGSKLTAGGAVVLQAQDQLTLQAAANTTNQTSTNSSQSMSVGVGIELGAKGGVGITLCMTDKGYHFTGKWRPVW